MRPTALCHTDASALLRTLLSSPWLRPRSRRTLALAALLPLIAPLPNPLRAQSPAGSTGERPLRPVHTYSIVARDSVTGELGVAVQSHWFSVGSVVPWAESGVGAVATQSFIDPAYGALGLDLMRAGKTAGQALAGLRAADAHPEVRQVAMVDADGNVAVFTGEAGIAETCQETGAGFSAQANLMLRPTVCDAMARAYRETEGDLAARLMAALEAAQAEGGDIRGRQSAALLVVAAESSGQPWNDRLFDLRVEDSPEPLAELGRLLQVARAYRHMNQGDAHVTRGDIDAAVEEYRAAEELLPNESEPLFWHAVTLASVGRVEASLPLFERAFEMHEQWRILVSRLPAAGLLPDDPELIERIVSVGESAGGDR